MNVIAFEAGRRDGIEAAKDGTTLKEIAGWYPGAASDGLINALTRKQCAELLGVPSLYGDGDCLTDAAHEAIADYDRGYLAGAIEMATRGERE